MNAQTGEMNYGRIWTYRVRDLYSGSENYYEREGYTKNGGSRSGNPFSSNDWKEWREGGPPSLPDAEHSSWPDENKRKIPEYAFSNFNRQLARPGLA
jgi:hypothetical protein